jgi:hypothetical protein
MEEGNESCIDK